MLSSQENGCAICKRSTANFRNSLAVDHDHHTGEIRGLLCFNCNKFVVGRRRKGVDAELLRLAADYLDKEYTGWVVPPKKKRRKKRRGKKLRAKSRQS